MWTAWIVVWRTSDGIRHRAVYRNRSKALAVYRDNRSLGYPTILDAYAD